MLNLNRRGRRVARLIRAIALLVLVIVSVHFGMTFTPAVLSEADYRQAHIEQVNDLIAEQR